MNLSMQNIPAWYKVVQLTMFYKERINTRWSDEWQQLSMQLFPWQ